MKKEYEALSVDVVKFEAQDVITVSLNVPSNGDKEGIISSIPFDPTNVQS